MNSEERYRIYKEALYLIALGDSGRTTATKCGISQSTLRNILRDGTMQDKYIWEFYTMGTAIKMATTPYEYSPCYSFGKLCSKKDRWASMSEMNRGFIKFIYIQLQGIIPQDND